MLSCFLRDPARAQQKWNKQTEAINVPNVGGETWETKCASGLVLNIPNVPNVELFSERPSEGTKEIEQGHREHQRSHYGGRDVGNKQC